MQLTTAMLRALKGSPISVLMALALAGQPVTVSWLEAITGYTDKSVSRALQALQEFGLITRNGRYAWQLAGGVVQLPLMVPELDEPEEPQEPPSGEPPTETIDGEARDPEKFRLGKIPSPALLASSGFNQNLDSSINQPLARQPADPVNFRVNSRELEQGGIREPARSRLAALAHVTPRLVRYHCATAPNSGLSVYRIEHGWPVPEDWVDPAEIDPPDDPPAARQGGDLRPAPAEMVERFDAAISALGGELSRADWATWVQPLELAGVDPGGALVARIGNHVAARWLEDHNIQSTLEGLLGAPLRIASP